MARTRGGDPERLIDLMWQPDTRVGRSGTTVGAVVDGAIDLADAEGLDAVTMRGLAERIGVGTMTLYGYVPGRAELVELMVDRVTGRRYDGTRLPVECASWQEALRHIASAGWELLLAHPWVAEAPAGRPILGPGVCRTYEAELNALEGIGLSDVDMDLTLTALHAQITQAARWQAALARAGADTGLDETQWWARHGPRLQAAMAGEDLPISARVGEAVRSAGDPRRTWEFAVGALVDGLERRLEG